MKKRKIIVATGILLFSHFFAYMSGRYDMAVYLEYVAIERAIKEKMYQ